MLKETVGFYIFPSSSYLSMHEIAQLFFFLMIEFSCWLVFVRPILASEENKKISLELETTLQLAFHQGDHYFR